MSPLYWIALIGIMVIIGIAAYSVRINATPALNQSPIDTSPPLARSQPSLPATQQVSPRGSMRPTKAEVALPWKTYSNGKFPMKLRYPSNITIVTVDQPSRVDTARMTEMVVLQGETTTIALEVVPNPKKLSAEQWLSERRTAEEHDCEMDCYGFTSPAKAIIIANRQALLQSLGGSVGTLNIYLPLTETALLWASAWSPGSATPSEDTRDLLVSVLASLSTSNLAK